MNAEIVKMVVGIVGMCISLIWFIRLIAKPVRDNKLAVLTIGRSDEKEINSIVKNKKNRLTSIIERVTEKNIVSDINTKSEAILKIEASIELLDEEATEYLDEDATEYLDEEATEYLDEEATEYLDEEATEYLDEEATEYLDEEATEYLDEDATEYIGDKRD